MIYLVKLPKVYNSHQASLRCIGPIWKPNQMIKKAEITDQSIIIYENLVSVFVVSLLAAVFCMGFGSFFFQLGSDDLFPRIFGAFFFFCGVLIIIGLPKYYAKMKDKIGAIFFEANKDGFIEYTPMDTRQNKYLWDAIEKIILTSKYIEKGLGDGTAYSRNLMFIFFKKNETKKFNFIQRRQRNLNISPKGYGFITVKLPKQDIAEIEEKLASFTNDEIKLIVCKCLEFNHEGDAEIITP